MKKNIKGFMLIETLLVSVVILTALIYMFVQFQHIETSYETTFKYNTTDNLYRVYNIKKYLLENGFASLATAVSTGSDKYIDLSACPSTYLTNTNLCVTLFDTLNIKTVLFTDEPPTNVISNLKNLYFVSENMKKFMDYLNYDDTNTGKYRIIVEFNDGTFGSLKIFI